MEFIQSQKTQIRTRYIPQVRKCPNSTQDLYIYKFSKLTSITMMVGYIIRSLIYVMCIWNKSTLGGFMISLYDHGECFPLDAFMVMI